MKHLLKGPFYLVEPFDSNTFIEKISAKEINETLGKVLYHYFQDFFIYGKIPTKEDVIDSNSTFIKTLVFENFHLDNYFFKDYENFHCKSTIFIEKFTSRVHLFSNSFDKTYFESYLLGKTDLDSSCKLEENYQGFLIIKPTINATIGEVFLKPPMILLQSANITCLVNRKVFFGGKQWELNGLSFQEQDKDISICATNALWIAFHGCSNIFKNIIPAPSEITISAGFDEFGNRLLPSTRGLNHRQISNAINYVGLISETRVRTPQSTYKLNHTLVNKNLKRFLYGYLNLGIPILLGYEIPKADTNISINDLQYLTGDETALDQHLVTVLGYKLEKETPREFQEETDDFNSVADFIESLVVHDDSLGPYAEIIIENSPSSEIKNRTENRLSFEEIIKQYRLSIKIPRDNGEIAYTRSLVVPLSPDIKVSYEKVSQAIREINTLISLSNENDNDNYENPFTLIWDVCLQNEEFYLKNYLKGTKLTKRKKLELLTYPYPKYFWVARALNFKPGESLEAFVPLFEFLYDSSGSPNGFCLFKVNFFKKEYKDILVNSISLFLDEIILDMEYSNPEEYTQIIISKRHLNLIGAS